MHSVALDAYLSLHRRFRTALKRAVASVAPRLAASGRRNPAPSATHDEIVRGGRGFGGRKTSVYVLSAVMFVLLALSIFLNLYEGAVGLLPPLIGAACVALFSFVWTYRVGTHATALLFGLNFALMCVGLFLFLRQGAPDGSSLFWFVVFPPMVMVSLGLRYGSLVFFCFYLVIFLLLFTPLDALLVHAYSRAIRIRFMLAMFGAFFFSWWVEYLRDRTYRLLIEAVDALERDSLTDPLTGLANRRDFYASLGRIMADCRRRGESYVLALMDIDHFKPVNDRYGHQIGDDVLRHVVAAIATQIRGSDRIFRWGGEEFAVIMPACGAEQGLAVAERIRRKMEETPYADARLPAPLTVTISIGLYHGDEAEDQDLPVRVADDNLYAAKAAGRNRVVIGGVRPETAS